MKIKLFLLVVLMTLITACAGGTSVEGSATNQPQTEQADPCAFVPETYPGLLYPAKVCKTDGWAIRIFDSDDGHHAVVLFAHNEAELANAHSHAEWACGEAIPMGSIGGGGPAEKGKAIVAYDDSNDGYKGGFVASYWGLKNSCFNMN